MRAWRTREVRAVCRILKLVVLPVYCFPHMSMRARLHVCAQVCKHMGPCEACLPQGEASYTQCFKCGGATKLHRVF